MEPPDWLPVANLILGLIGVWVLAVRTTARRAEYPDEIRELFRLMLVLFVGLVIVSASMIDDRYQAPGWVVIGVTLVKVYALVVLWRSRHTLYRTGTRAPGNGDEENPNEDI